MKPGLMVNGKQICNAEFVRDEGHANVKNTESRKSYRQGFIDGLTSFAWWKDDVQVVGTMPTPLKEVLSTLESTWNYKKEYVDTMDLPQDEPM